MGFGQSSEALELRGCLLVLEKGALLLTQLVELWRDFFVEKRLDLLDLEFLLCDGFDGLRGGSEHVSLVIPRHPTS